ncbi:MAG: hypothetical protein KDI39_15790 [Pseudomonadales bacterium]|nr:hypothetical protein [Pseudomonadales bacterium]
MQKGIILGGGLTLLAALVMTGCEINDDVNPVPGSTTTVTVTPSLGKILNAKVVLKNAKTGAELGSGKTDDTGTAKINTQKTTDPVVVEVQGVDGAQGATYFDEAKNDNIPLPATQKIRAIVPTLADNANVGVTVLTEFATQAAIKTAGDLSKVTTQVATQANEQIKKLLASELGTASLLTPPTIIGKDTSIKTVITANNAANSYALKLAGLAKLGGGDTPVLDMLQKFSDDLSDNKLDGKKGTVEIDYQTGETEDITDALQGFITAYANAAQIDSIYTAQILNAFQVIEGDIVITIGGGGTGSGCVLSVSAPQAPVFKVCYKNLLENAVCGNANVALNAAAQAYATSGASLSFAQGSCVDTDLTVDFASLTGKF